MKDTFAAMLLQNILSNSSIFLSTKHALLKQLMQKIARNKNV